MATTEAKRSEVTRVTHAQYYKVCNWIASNGERLMSERPSYLNATGELIAAVGFPVAVQTLREALETTGITWEPKKKESTRSGRITQKATRALRDRLADAEKQIEVLAADLATVGQFVHHLYAKLGEKYPVASQTAAKQMVLIQETMKVGLNGTHG